MTHANWFAQSSIAAPANHARPQINFGAAALMNQSAMVHKLPPATGVSPAATA
jgi:hypothetical protein